jgi:nucleotide-binding universal stress UspA family protein
MKNVLVPLDGTSVAENVIGEVEKLCRPEDHLVLFTVVAPHRPLSTGSRPAFELTPLSAGSAGMATNRDVPVKGETTDQAAQSELSEASDYLEGRAARLRKSGYRVDVHAVIDDKPAEAIINFARQTQPDFIAMVRHTHGFKAMLGSVTTSVVKSNIRPVLLVPTE